MKRIVCLVMMLVIMMASAVPALAGGCYYKDTFGDHDWYQATFAYPTCTEDGYYGLKCNECGQPKKVINGKAYGHNWEKSGEKAATCTEKGSASYWCIECGKKKTDTVKALGHSYKVLEVTKEATCQAGGQEKVKCSRCNEVTTRETKKSDHVYGEWQVSVEATDASKGVRSGSCVYCGKARTEEYYPEGTLYRGIDDKEAVRQLQTWLVDCGYLNDSIDGIFGKKSEQAIKDFQTKAGFNADGIAWPQTYNELEKEWQILKGIYVEPVVVTCCTRMEDENGTVEFFYCPDHQILMDAVAVLFEDIVTDEEYINALALVRQMYQEEVDMRYADWLAASPVEEQPNVVGAQAMFIGYLNSQVNIWNRQYGANSAETLTKINDMLHDQWFDLCGILDVVVAE